MSEYKRLTWWEKVHGEHRIPHADLDREELLLELAELEDKIESGQLIELPCKVGDKAQRITRRATMNEIEKIKQIDKMYEAIPSLVGSEHKYGMCVHHRELVAEALVNAGYGDIKQAVSEFAEKIKENLEEIFGLATRKGWGSAYEYINELVKEVCGE